MASQWYYTKNGEHIGPVSSSQLRQLAASGGVKRNDYVFKVGTKDWVTADKVKGLIPATSTAFPPPFPPLPDVARAAGDTQVATAVIGGYTMKQASVILNRWPKLTGLFSRIRVSLDGAAVGTIGGGFPGGLLDVLASRTRSLSFSVPHGSHVLEFSGGGMKRTAHFTSEPGTTLKFTLHFSNLGALGGGLTITEEGR